MSPSALWNPSAHVPSHGSHDNAPNEFMFERSPQLPSLLSPELVSLSDELVTVTSSIPITSDLPLSAGFPFSNGGITPSASLPVDGVTISTSLPPDGGDAAPSGVLSAPISTSIPFVVPTIDSSFTDVPSIVDSSVLGILPTTDSHISDIYPTTEIAVSNILPTIITSPSLDLPTVTIDVPLETITVDPFSITPLAPTPATISPASIASLPSPSLSPIPATAPPGTQLSWGAQFSSAPATISASGSFSLSQSTSVLSSLVTSTSVLSSSAVAPPDLKTNATTSTMPSSPLPAASSSSTQLPQSSPGTTDNEATITSAGGHRSPASKPTAKAGESEFIKKPGAIAGTVTAVGIVVAALAVGIIILIRMRRRRGLQRLPLQIPDEESGSMLRRNSTSEGISPGPPFEQAQPADPFAGPSRIPANYQPLDMVEVPESNLNGHPAAPVGNLPTSPVDLVDPYGPNTMEDTRAKTSEPYTTSAYSTPGSARPESVAFPRDPYTSDPSIRGALDYILSDEDLSTIREDKEESRSLLNPGPYGTRAASPRG